MQQNWESCLYSFFDQANNIYGWCVLLALIIIQYIRILSKRHSCTLQILKNDVGVINISRKAFNELVYGVCSQMDMAGRPSIKLRARRGKIYLYIKIKLYANQPLNEVSVYLQDHITQALKENLGVERIGAIDICVTSFRRSKNPSPAVKNPSPVSFDEETEE